MKVEQQPAYLLHARPYSETSLLVDFFTREHGRLMLMAKGARGAVGGGTARRRARGRLRGVLLPFKPLLASWSGKGQLPILTAVEQSAPAVAQMKGAQLASGFYLNELLLRLLHRYDSHETLFAHYDLAIRELAAEHSPRRVLRIFEKKLLNDIGFGAVLDRDVETREPINTEQQYHYLLEKGPVQVSPTAAPLGEHILTISGRTLCALREENFPSELELREAQRLTRTLIDRQLGGRALRSRKVILEMNKYNVREG